MKKYILCTLSFLIVIISCNKEDETDRSYARINTLGVKNISTTGVTLNAEIYNAENITIEDHGFVYNLKSIQIPDTISENQHYENRYEKESLGSKAGNGLFETTLTRNLISGEVYTSKAYVISDGKTVYGEPVEFKSLGGMGPVIYKIVPDTAYFGDTINIIGQNFSMQKNFNEVAFHTTESEILYSSDTLIKTILPEHIWMPEIPISVTVAKNTISSPFNLIITPPKIDSVSNTTILSGMNIKLYGSHLNDIYNLRIDNQSPGYYGYDHISDSLITLKVPGRISEGNVPFSYSYLGKAVNIPDYFYSTIPAIHSVAPLNVWIDTLIKVKGPNIRYLNSLLSDFGTPEIVSDSMVQVKIEKIPISNKIYGFYNYNKIYAEDSIDWMPPVIDKITPTVAYNNEKITIHGERFFPEMKVKIANYNLYTNFIDENTVEFNVPKINSGTYQMELHYGIWKFGIQENISFEIPPINITGVNPSSAKRGDIIEISLDNMNSNESYSVHVDQNETKLIEVGDSYIKVQIGHDSLLSDYPSVKVYNGGRTDQNNSSFQAIEPWQFVLEESKFRPNYAAIAYPNNTPVILTREYDNYDHVLLQFDDFTNKWDKIATHNMSGNFPKVLSKNDMMYFISYHGNNESGNSIQIESYSMDRNEWNQEGQVQYNGEMYQFFAFMKEDKIYVGDKFFMTFFDLNDKTWTDITTMPTDEIATEGVSSFVINDRCYVQIHNNNKSNDDSTSEFWEYHTNSDIWTYIPGCPFINYGGTTYCTDEQNAYYFVRVDNNLREMWTYNSMNNTWTKQHPPAGHTSYGLSFYSNGNLYFGRSKQYGVGLYLSKIHLNDIIQLDDTN
ncbi:IPT/TIG domain-containing protein [Marinifilum caeruleilacunae]|uniref:IPT/TIG domain-containing protein n=1 Tax=Marinifilum caeruleilacunae TaxID=2499076 RepID=A0ABX1WWP7_9BACT|nr:IPT/TIG domain-containing protein [Marinifilum caeruleilacunae]NOU60555.1 hypothetical protein [Marinifilum caeruleilacunae]